MLLKEVSYTPQGCIYLIKKYSKKVILWNNITIKNNFSIWIHFKMLFILVMVKLNIQQLLLQLSVSHDPSEIIHIVNVKKKKKKKQLLNIFVETMNIF